MASDLKEIHELLEAILKEDKPGRDLIGRLESAILLQIPDADDDERFDDLLSILAQYEPIETEFMYVPQDLKKECRWVLSRLEGGVGSAQEQ